MAKYTINYACGHGSVEKDIVGPGKDRERKIDWMQSNMDCPDCYRAKKVKEDATASKTAKICLVPAAEPIISIEVDGQIETNKDGLYLLGYRWADSTRDGLFSFISMSKPKRALTILYRVEAVEQTAQWLNEQQVALANLGYKVTQGLSPIDQSFLAKLIQDKQSTVDTKLKAQSELAEIEASDPRPTISSLTKRIRGIESDVGHKWNGKIYGRSGKYNFYVNDVNYKATDAEVAERELILKAIAAWDEKYKTIIEAAK